MPTSLSGLIVFSALLVPGFVHYLQRRRRAPQRSLSPLIETATMVTVSLATTSVVLLAFGLLRMWRPQDTPDVGRLLLEGGEYGFPRVGYLLAWGALVLGLSSMLAFWIATKPPWPSWVTDRFTPLIVDTSSWYEVFEDAADGSYVFVGCDLRDGSYVSGVLDWYSTEIDEIADRDLVLASPITVKVEDQTSEVEGFTRLIVSARDVVRIYVTYLDEDPAGIPTEAPTEMN